MDLDLSALGLVNISIGSIVQILLIRGYVFSTSDNSCHCYCISVVLILSSGCSYYGSHRIYLCIAKVSLSITTTILRLLLLINIKGASLILLVRHVIFGVTVILLMISVLSLCRTTHLILPDAILGISISPPRHCLLIIVDVLLLLIMSTIMLNCLHYDFTCHASSHSVYPLRFDMSIVMTIGIGR